MRMQRKERARSRKKKQFPVMSIAIGAGVLLALTAASAGIYIYKGQKYKEAFFPNTVINGIDASEKTVEEVKELISAEIAGYTLTIEERGGDTEQITREDIQLHSEFDGSLEKLLEAQNPMKWGSRKETKAEYEIATMVVYDEALLTEKIDSLQCFLPDYVKMPEDARLSEYVSGQGYSIIPETPGNLLVKETAVAGITDAIHNLKEGLSFEELGAYEKAAVTREDEELVKVADHLNKQVGVTIKHQFGDKTEVLDGDTIQTWLSVNADKTIALDKEGIAAYVKDLASRYNTAYKPKTLKTSYGKTVTIAKGFYGWRINQGAEIDEIYNIIRSGESQTREPVYYQRAASYGANDYGDTYVEINLTAQHMFFYKDGKLLVEADFVSGNTSRKYDTPPGAYPLTYKERNATLKGENYRTPVSYWMPFNGNIGMHDANWRSSFGGTIYKTNGSHGCINLPPSAAKTIYENISQGMPVLCYFLEGTEGKSTASAEKETTPAATTPVQTPETTAPPETTAVPETSPAPPETTAPETVPETTKKPAGPGEVATTNEQESKKKGPGE